jgi:hypothetical protein
LCIPLDFGYSRFPLSHIEPQETAARLSAGVRVAIVLQLSLNAAKNKENVEMKLTKIGNLIQSLMMVGLMAVSLGYVPSSYGQEASADDAGSSQNQAAVAADENVGNGYEIGGELVLATPKGASAANTAVGYSVLTANTTGTDNTGLGNSALKSNTTGFWNTAAGQQALKWNTTGSSNTAFGWQALVNNHKAYRNTAVGVEALHNTDIDIAGLGIQNTAVGWQANFYNQDGTNNTGLGYQACLNVVEGSNVTCIGASSGPATDVTGPATYIANVYNRPTGGTGNPLVCISSDGLLGTTGCAPSSDLQQQVIDQQAQKIQAQGEQIANLQQRLARLEALFGKTSN